jgi:hypothetical protein
MATLDVISEARAKQALSLSPADVRLSDVLATAITAVSQHLDDVCGPIVQRTVTDVLDTPGDLCHVMLTTGPVSSITSVTFYDSGVSEVLTAETLTAAGGYLAELEDRIRPDGTAQMLTGRLRRRSSFSDWWWKRGRLQVVYSAGRYATTAAAAGSRFELAAMLTLKSSWRAWEQSAVQIAPGEFVVPAGYFPSFVVPDAALELIARDRVHVVGMA